MIHSNVKERGYHYLYRSQVTNTCPGCGHSNWLVGRMTAECAICATALAIAENHRVVLANDVERVVAVR